MFSTYFKVALRHMGRNKFYSILNILALSVGMAVFILIGLWMHDELSFNRSFDHYDRIAMITRQFNYNAMRISLPGSPYTMRDELLTKCPNVMKNMGIKDNEGFF
jgi:putative ABC transport system permease protein